VKVPAVLAFSHGGVVFITGALGRCQIVSIALQIGSVWSEYASKAWAM